MPPALFNTIAACTMEVAQLKEQLLSPEPVIGVSSCVVDSACLSPSAPTAMNITLVARARGQVDESNVMP